MGRLKQVDPIKVARPWLLSRTAVTDALGGEGRVLAANKPPYPCCVLTDPPGNDRGLRHLMEPLLQIEVLGSVSSPKHILRDAMYDILEELMLLPEQPVTDPTLPVVTGVRSSGGGGWVPLPSGQPRYVATVALSMHPGRSA